jgi:hypothetical protein
LPQRAFCDVPPPPRNQEPAVPPQRWPTPAVTGVEPPADLDCGFFDARDEGVKVVQGGEAEEAAAVEIKYRAPAEVVFFPVREACLVPLARLLAIPGPAVTDVLHDALVGGEPGEVFPEGILPGDKRESASDQGVHAAEVSADQLNRDNSYHAALGDPADVPRITRYHGDVSVRHRLHCGADVSIGDGHLGLLPDCGCLIGAYSVQKDVGNPQSIYERPLRRAAVPAGFNTDGGGSQNGN